MRTNGIYRTLMAAGIGLMVAASTGCEELDRQHKQFVERNSKQWDLTMLQIKYQVAEQQYKTGDYDKCKASLKDLLTSPTPFAPAHVLAARVDLESGSLEGAATQLKQAIRIDGTKPEPYYLLGVTYQRWRKLDTACDYYQQASDHKPSDASYVLAVAEMKISLGKLDEAQTLLEDKMMYFEQSPAVRIALARIAGLKGDPATAARQYREAMLLAPEDQNVRFSYAQALFDAHNFRDAAKILEAMRNDSATLAKLETSSGKDKDALDVETSKATKVSLLMMLGQSYLEMQRPFDARECFQQVIRDDSKNNGAYLGLGQACVLTNELSVSTAAARQVLRTNPDNVQAMILLAVIQQKQKKWVDALDTLAGAAKLSPKDSTVMCMEGLSAMQLGRQAEAVTYFERAVAANPKDGWAQQLLNSVKPAPAPADKNAAEAAPAETPEPTSTVTTAAPSGIKSLDAP